MEMEDTRRTLRTPNIRDILDFQLNILLGTPQDNPETLVLFVWVLSMWVHHNNLGILLL
jgi:hypothetical protein